MNCDFYFTNIHLLLPVRGGLVVSLLPVQTFARAAIWTEISAPPVNIYILVRIFSKVINSLLERSKGSKFVQWMLEYRDWSQLGRWICRVECRLYGDGG